jgi:hypothetical protein
MCYDVGAYGFEFSRAMPWLPFLLLDDKLGV